MLSFHIVKAKQSQILIDREQQKSMYFGELLVSNNLDVLNQRSVNTLGHVELLEQVVILLSLVVKLVNNLLVEYFFVHVHQAFNIFQADVIFKGSC